MLFPESHIAFEVEGHAAILIADLLLFGEVLFKMLNRNLIFSFRNPCDSYCLASFYLFFDKSFSLELLSFCMLD